jgi:DNA-directed RNA polymerase specialized sigma24 family protein
MTSPFQDTRWTLVSRSRGADVMAKTALSELCAAYYEPVVVFLRSEGRTDDAARELAHGFFARLLEGGRLERAEQERGRFRSYLLGALKHFLADQKDHVMAAKRGGGVDHLQVDAEASTSAPGLQIVDANATAPDAAFDRQWAISLLASALSDLESEMVRDGKQALFERLKPWLTGDAGADHQANAAESLEMSADAVKQAVHRLRKRFRALVKKRIADTVEGSAQAEAEWQHLMAALRQA